jgi:integrase
MADGKLTALKAKNLSTPGHHFDGGGLYLRIAEGRKSWMFRYKVAGKDKWLGLGAFDDFTLADARESARECRRLRTQGIDPLEHRRAAREAAQAAQAMTFKHVAGLYIDAHKDGWRNAKHAAQWEATLTAYAYPVLGDKPVSAITVSHILAVLEPIWKVKPETASRLRGRIENVLDHAAARHLRTGENPARWRGHLAHLLPERAKLAKVEHHAAVPYADLPRVYDKLAESKGTAALCLRFLILTAARSGEARGATWAEINPDAGIWTIPAERMKADKEHRVPLSAPAVEILRDMAALGTDPAKLVFEGGRKDRPLSDVAVSKALRAAGGDGYTVHGMRSTFRDWCEERTSYSGAIAEAALAHTNKDKVEAAYLRTDHMDQRRRLMAEWGTFATTPASAMGEVVAIGKARV